MANKINPDDLICMDELDSRYNFRVDLAYARKDNLLFGERIYRKEAKLWLYKDLADIVCEAARNCYEEHGLRFVLYDGLRTIDAQKAMMQTRKVKENPHWLIEPRLLSLPGNGGHPRGMAIDIGLEDENGVLLDMGCPFDFMGKEAHRNYPHASEVKNNRAMLDSAMLAAAENPGIPLFPLPEEWWDFRLPASFCKGFSPLSELDLPNHMKVML